MEHFDDPRLTAMGLLSEAFSGVEAKLAPALSEEGLSVVDFDALIRLARSPGRRLRMSDLAAQTSLSTSGITRVVDRLERSGLVERVACATDRRTSYAAITGEGVERLARVVPRHLDDIDRWFTGLLSPEQLDVFLAALRKIRDAVRPCATAGAAGAGRTEHDGPAESSGDAH
ncbi:MarR family winged helix-turn-helix transcriptional regulator [Bailinhaonella thermotolerans]|uniref:MarR family transcriptional regulator n=1 Tax=Bailinhaonella thermotolerans TaxID=1070861 RepID=A0A3A4A7X7_9ACTN|nr:MarR family transcriptional regulator [Bailinhaonella thermotolerans]RJL22117.1 MarR family transcriptional regulator [Bailinhaonella thermotolerans]